eukprot:CAMPEP_0113967638 /NCGR_PEP_ID=MMETSP0011_2-20120614/9056_1 /TAXON_ID=101924 /ORGANISM="Rhodosorus marinus" /LENGTH=52 /DNA_ID=CAMNT_0000980573 /DNA_START=477 /DNA_END=635 /DNA_ORIENTATION=+ /assembly_acc=CAM_ASM_000156
MTLEVPDILVDGPDVTIKLRLGAEFSCHTPDTGRYFQSRGSTGHVRAGDRFG